ncbi:FAD-dependent thymidylate synthase [Aureimonas pseudogalii]|uniref:FAD-dependent thymidylate synthase n=1 Tax=Aureimonas pseudogalii TaxID=1744844 RepID=A0A7W6E9I0_9HYPH|nr:FAD-dependent thymidylate synthase [Aureimonas pseudogalii]MBB3997225.1 thymidylate synthase (FAD) [Aureimonas pseudogalii]
MSARVFAITKPLVPECQTAGEFIVFAARVSNPANQANRETDAKLLAYLMRNRHWSPFEMVSATVEVVTTRDIARQLLRHRSFSFQEFSQRYAEVDAEPVFREARMQDERNRQNSVECENAALSEGWIMAQRMAHAEAIRIYQGAIEKGIAKEVARAVLPEGLTPSTLYVSGSFRSWLHYLDVREEAGTQKEHRLLANEIRAALAEHEPLIFGEAA